MKTLLIGIARYRKMKARTLKIARGERKVKADEPKVWFTSPGARSSLTVALALDMLGRRLISSLFLISLIDFFPA